MKTREPRETVFVDANIIDRWVGFYWPEHLDREQSAETLAVVVAKKFVRLALTPTANEEVAQIPTKKPKHDALWSGIQGHFLQAFFEDPAVEIPIRDARAAELFKHHESIKDCRVVAEAEMFGGSLLLTCDSDLIENLSRSARVDVKRPTLWLVERLDLVNAGLALQAQSR